MFSIIIVFPKLEDGNKIRTMLVRNGYEVDMVCNSASQVLSLVNDLDGGLIITGYRLPDMQYMELADCIPKNFNLLLIASASRLGEQLPENVVSITMPLKSQDLLGTIEMMSMHYRQLKKKEREAKRGKKNEKERIQIDRAKALLMERNHMTEEEAHRYIQKTSMNNGNSFVETAEMILLMF